MWTPVVYTGTDTQTPGLVGYNLYSSDPALQNMVQLSSAGWHQELLAQGEVLGSETTLKLAEQANRHPPELYTRSVAGERIDVVRFPPAWHDMMAITRRHGIANRSFADTRPGSWLACAASQYMHSQIETGTIFPSNMTQACIPVLQHESPLFDQLAPKLYSMEHDARDIPLAYKTAITVGMGLTVMQGKSAYSAKNNQNGIAACAVGMTGRGREYRLTGHKWVFSAPMCDAHLVLAQSAGGYSCFFVPRWCQDGRKNTVFIQRLYDRVGNRSNSSSEVVFDDALGILVGEEGKGVAMMIAMVNCIRVNCTLASAGMLRQAFSQALYYARHHNVFGKPLAEQPVMTRLLADMSLEAEAAMTIGVALSRQFTGVADELGQAWYRIMTPAAKFWICNRAVDVCAEASTMFGGNGYAEDSPMSRLYRDAPVYSIWEGAENDACCMDVLRAVQHSPVQAASMLDGMQELANQEPRLLPLLSWLRSAIKRSHADLQSEARLFTQKLVVLTQACVLIKYASHAVREAFIASRTDPDWGISLGVSSRMGNVQRIVTQSWRD